MSTYTTNYNLKKPEGGDAVNIADINGNMDIVDEQLKANADGLLQTYTKAQMDAFISTINGNISSGNSARYTKTESDARYSQSSHTHDSRYYTESEMDTKLSNKSDTSHNHDSRYPLIGHTHDERYYTEAEIDTKVSSINSGLALLSARDRVYLKTATFTAGTAYNAGGYIDIWGKLPEPSDARVYYAIAIKVITNANGSCNGGMSTSYNYDYAEDEWAVSTPVAISSGQSVQVIGITNLA